AVLAAAESLTYSSSVPARVTSPPCTTTSRHSRALASFWICSQTWEHSCSSLLSDQGSTLEAMIKDSAMTPRAYRPPSASAQRRTANPSPTTTTSWQTYRREGRLLERRADS